MRTLITYSTKTGKNDKIVAGAYDKLEAAKLLTDLGIEFECIISVDQYN
jgi:menaquinone-dependent protoporphyrinogen IX oxidase